MRRIELSRRLFGAEITAQVLQLDEGLHAGLRTAGMSGSRFSTSLIEKREPLFFESPADRGTHD